jgi:hypothetical protein
MSNFSVGQRVVWQYKPAGGLGYEISVQAQITKIGKTRIQIEAPKQSGELVRRWVSPDSIKPLEEQVPGSGLKSEARAEEPQAKKLPAEPGTSAQHGPIKVEGTKTLASKDQGMRFATRLTLPQGTRARAKRKKVPSSEEKPYPRSEDQLREDAAWQQVKETGKPMMFEGTLLIPEGMNPWKAIELLPDEIRDKTRTSAQEGIARVVSKLINQTRAELRQVAEKRGELDKWNSFSYVVQMAIAESVVRERLEWPEKPLEELIEQYRELERAAASQKPKSRRRK